VSDLLAFSLDCTSEKATYTLKQMNIIFTTYKFTFHLLAKLLLLLVLCESNLELFCKGFLNPPLSNILCKVQRNNSKIILKGKEW
jgi:hypothetical protein